MVMTQSNALVLPAILDLPMAAGLLNDCRAALAAGEGLAIDARDVAKITTPCVQVLAAAKRAFAQTGGPALQITDASPAFRGAISDLALCGLLSIDKDCQ